MMKYGLLLCLALSSDACLACDASSPSENRRDPKWVLLKALVCYDIKDRYHYNQLKRLENRMNLNPCDAESRLCLTLYQRHTTKRALIANQVQENLTDESYKLFPNQTEVLCEFLCFPRLRPLSYIIE